MLHTFEIQAGQLADVPILALLIEICYRLLLPEIKAEVSFEESSDFFKLLQLSGTMEISFEDYTMKSNAFRLMDEIREPVWSKIIENCGTFEKRNSDAEKRFLEVIFSKNYQKERDMFLKQVL